MGYYDLTPPDLEDEELKRQAALSALATEPMQLPEPELLQEPGDPVGALASLSAPPTPRPEFTPEPVAPAPEPMPPPMAAPTPQPMAAAEPPPPPQVDPYDALMRKGEEQRQKALDAYGKDEPGVNGWALLADVAFNKGKSIPQLLQQVDNDKRAWREGRQKILTGGSQSDPVSQMLAMERIKVAQGREGRLGENDEAKRARLEGAAAQDKTSADQLRNYAKGQGFYTEAMEGMSFKDLMGMKGFLRTDQDHANAPRIAQDKALERTATTHAGNQADYDDREIKGDVAGTIRARQVAEEQALLPERQLTPQQAAAEARAKAEAERRAAHDASAEARASRGEERQLQNDAVAFNRDYSKNTDSAVKVAKSVGVLEDSLAKNPKLFDSENNMAAGVVGFVGGDKAAQRVRGYQAGAATSPEKKAQLQEQIAFRDNYLKATAFSLKDATGLSGNLTEQDQNIIRTGASPNATLAEMQAGMEIMARDARDKLAREGTARPDLADENLVASGLDPERWAPGLAAARKKHASKAQPAAAPADSGEYPGQARDLADYQAEFGTNPDGSPISTGTEGSLADAVPTKPTRHAPTEWENLGASGGRGADLPPPAAAPPPSTAGQLLPFFVNGKRKMITQEQAEWLLLNKPGIEVTQ